MSFSCAQDMGDIDRTQPGRIDKSMFDGSDEWYMRQTVIDVPFNTGFSFVGEQADTELIRWRVTENYLYAHRAHDWMEGTEEYFLDEDENYFGAPIAVYAIRSHFDVQRQYNPATGEENNVIEENSSDRLWYERDYMRVDWSHNLVHDFRFGTPASIPSYGVNYYVDENDGSKEALKVEEDYIDIVGMIFAEPEMVKYWYWVYPACYFNPAQDCRGQRIKIRTSFMKKDSDNDYKVAYYDDKKQQKFGFFRTSRLEFDRYRGSLSNAEINLINRWNLWKKGQADVPVADRETRVIPYYINDVFPEDLKIQAKKVICTWNNVFKSTVAVAKGIDVDPNSEKVAQVDIEDALNNDLNDVKACVNSIPGDDILVFCPNNPVKEGDPEVCGEPGLNPQIGDLRYNMIFWVANPQASSPLGYGPAASDSETGELFQANAFIYGNEIETYTSYVIDLIKLLQCDGETLDENGITECETVLENYTSGRYLKDYIAELDVPISPSAPQITVVSPSVIKSAINKRFGKQFSSVHRYLNESDFNNIETLSQRTKKAEGTLFEARLMSEPLKRQAYSSLIDDQNQLPEDLNQAGLVDFLRIKRLKDHEELQRLLGEKTVMLQFSDETLLSWAIELKDMEPEMVTQIVRRRIFFGTALHEVGHNWGLRHNFRSAADAINFFEPYWTKKIDQARNDTNLETKGTLQPEYIRKATGADDKNNIINVAGNLREYQYTSIMDYLRAPNASMKGLGAYDYAAIHYGYADQVQVFKAAGSAPQYNAHFYEEALSGEYHYTHLPYLLTNSDPASADLDQVKASMYSRGWVSLEKDSDLKRCSKDVDCEGSGKPICGKAGYCVECMSSGDCSDPNAPYCNEVNSCMAHVEVPFQFCSDEMVGDSWNCYRFSEGADFYEKIKAQANSYESRYFLRNFRRGKALFQGDYVPVNTFSTISAQLQYSVYQSYIKRNDPTFINDVTRGQHFAVGQVEVINFFNNILQGARPGVYRLGDGNIYENQRAILDFGKFQKEEKLGPGEVLLKPGYAAKTEMDLYDTSNGFHYWDKVAVSGNLMDKVYAMIYFGNYYFFPVGVDASGNTRKYAVNLYTLFPNEIRKMMGGLYMEDHKTYAPYYKVTTDPDTLEETLTYHAHKAVFLDPEEEEEFNTSEKRFLNPDMYITTRDYAIWTAVAYFSQSWVETSLMDSYTVGVRGGGDSYEPDFENMTEGVDYIQVTHPHSKKTYYAVKTSKNRDDSDFYSPAWRLIELTRSALQGDPGATSHGTTGLFEKLEIMKGYLQMFGW